MEADEVAASSKVVPTAASEAAAKAKEAAGMHAEVHDVKVSYAEAMTEHLEGLIEMLSTAGAGGEQRLPQRTGCVQCPVTQVNACTVCAAGGEFDRLSGKELVALACVAEMETNASKAAGMWRPVEARRFLQPEAREALAAAWKTSQTGVAAGGAMGGAVLKTGGIEAACEGDARDRVEVAAASMARELHVRICTLWRACGLSEAGLTLRLQEASVASCSAAEDIAQGAKAWAAVEELARLRRDLDQKTVGVDAAAASTVGGDTHLGERV